MDSDPLYELSHVCVYDGGMETWLLAQGFSRAGPEVGMMMFWICVCNTFTAHCLTQIYILPNTNMYCKLVLLFGRVNSWPNPCNNVVLCARSYFKLRITPPPRVHADTNKTEGSIYILTGADFTNPVRHVHLEAIYAMQPL
jgi:hypothetical protein